MRMRNAESHGPQAVGAGLPRAPCGAMQHFASTDAVYRIKRNLLDRLRRNPAIRRFQD